MRAPFGPVAEFQAEIRERFQTRRANLIRYGQRNMGGSWRTNPDHMSDAVLNNLLEFAQHLVPNLENCKLVIAGYHGYCYSNDIALLRELEALTVLKPLKMNQMAVTRPRNCVQLKNSLHSHRSYFRDRSLTDSEYTNLRNFLAQRTDLRRSPALQEWLADSNTALHMGQTRYTRRYTMRHWFVDHDAGIPLLLELVVPKLIRQTKPIQLNN